MNKFTRIITMTALLACHFFISQALAAGDKPAQPLSLVITALKEVQTTKNGKTVTHTEPAEETVSGDVLIYTLTYENTGKEPLKGVKLVDPLPADIMFIPGSIEGDEADVTYSIDEGKSFHPYPVTYEEKLPDGKIAEREASPDMITHIRWTLKSTVKPGASGSVGFKAKVK